jgi:hypothetical protein
MSTINRRITLMAGAWLCASLTGCGGDRATGVEVHTLAVVVAGTGSGIVKSSAGIDCGTICSESHAAGTAVTLTATASSGSEFGAWSGGCTGSAGTCVLTMTAATEVTATFTQAAYMLTVAKTGPGAGVVTSQPAGIDCGPTCEATFAGGEVLLTAAASEGSGFGGWGGACASWNTHLCRVTLSAATAVTAQFATTPTVSTAPLTVTSTTATSGGTVTADGGAPILARGVVWGAAANPTLSGNRTVDGTGTGSFVSALAGLTPETRYHIRAYATNFVGTAYGEEVSFTTAEGPYAITVLGQFNGMYTLANGVNQECRVAGSYYIGDNRFGAYVWAPGTGFQGIGPVNSNDASGFAINRAGTVAGLAMVGQAYRAFTWSEAAGIRLFEPLPGSHLTQSYASASNSQGMVAGAVSLANEQAMAAVVWRADGTGLLLRGQGGSIALARAINEAGVVAGFLGERAAVWPASDQDPVFLPGTAGQAWGINDRGDVVGVSGPRAVLWRGGQDTQLPALPGHGAATARAVAEPDAAGRIRIVGFSEPTHWAPSIQRRPVIWTVAGADVQVEELYPPAGHPGAIAKSITVRNGELVIVGTSYTPATAFGVMWSTSKNICAP